MSFNFSQDPFENLDQALQLAKSAEGSEATAVSLATASKDGLPSVRTVYFKGMIRGGLSFYTNYNSKKSLQLFENPNAAMLFFWPKLFQQVKISGTVEKLTREESEKYFASRPRLSKVGAWASNQSAKVESSAELQRKVDEFEKKFSGQDVPCPPHWGGFRLLPLEFEFWFGREGRLHERYVYQRTSVSEAWKKFQRNP